MASGSPRNRIDQFFVSKKRKNVSPISKSGRSEKGGRHTDEGSPSAEGSLDNYLVTSEDNFNARLYRTGDSLVRQDIVKRNLAADINCSLDNDYKQPVSSAQGHEVSDATIREIVNELPKLADVVMGDPALKDNCSDCRQDVESLELKQFAAGLLSLYCSEFQSRIDSTPGLKVDDHERHGTSTLLKRKISVPQKLCNTSGESHIGEENISSDEKLEDIKSGIVGDAAGPAFGLSTKVSDCDDTTATEARLRRCSNITKPSTNVAECYTPGSLIVKACVQETPKSTCGSSMFSPGEAFWNEAIQLADGLCAPMANDSSHASENLVEDQPNMKNSCNVRNHDGKPRRTLDQSEIGIRNMEKGTPLRLSGKHTKDSVKEVSPLPVKHFDFSFEDNYLDESTALPCHADDLMNDKQYKFNSFNCKDIKVSKNFIIGGTSYTNEKMNEVQEVASVDAVCKKDMLSNQKTDSLAYNSPHNKVRTVIGAHESDETATPSSSVSRNDSLDLSSWLPCEICRIYRKKGISKLYNWQVDCLKVDGVMLRRNLVYCASTSAGKSFVAEILMLRRVILTAKMALLVLPYVSICAEKAEHLELLLEPLGKHVRSYYGNQGGGTLPKDTSVAVCTIEKANSLINRLLEEGRLSELGIIVIDELHMVGDPSRGYLLELLLTKLRYAAGEGNLELSGGESSGGSSNKADPAQGLQIVGMSATMPNVAAVADWLQAALYQTEFRPVPLEEFIKVGNSIYNKSMELARTISKVADLGGKDPDHVVELCNEVVQEGNSVLIFCSSRKGCESTARHVAKFLKKFTVDVHENNCEFADITSAIDSLRKCPAGLDPILEETLPSGVAFHHAGLTVEEREIVETCYRRGLLRVLTATSTLAAGVNLPARRVIFRQPRIGRDFIDGTRYKQMAGRAGRTGIDTKGESVVLADLSRAREGFVLASDLHLVYLVTPINVDVEPDWELYYERFMQLSPLD